MMRCSGILGATVAAVTVLGFVLSSDPAEAAFPEKGKPITIIVPYAAGGVTDTGARLMAAALEKELSTPVQVENKPGAASLVGLTELVRAKPDGYTLSYAVLPTVITHYATPSSTAIYTRENFQPVAMHHLVPMVLAVPADSPYKSVDDLVEAARGKPGTIKISDSGLMANPHMEVLMLEHAAGVQFASVHFTGGAPSVTALLGGHVDVLAGGVADALSHARAGTFRVLAVAGEQPDKFLPDVPTFKSLGYDVVSVSATGLLAPAGTPDDVISTLSAAIQKVIKSPEHQQKLTDMGLTPYYLDPQAYTQFWKDTEARVKPILQSVQTQ